MDDLQALENMKKQYTANDEGYTDCGCSDAEWEEQKQKLTDISELRVIYEATSKNPNSLEWDLWLDLNYPALYRWKETSLTRRRDQLKRIVRNIKMMKEKDIWESYFHSLGKKQ